MSNLYLKHHGIRGQKWGKRNGPPYPLDQSSYTSYEKKFRFSDKQKKFLKTLAISIGITAAVGVGAYYVNRYRNMNFDKVLKSGTNIQHMSKRIDDMLNEPFYASYLKNDNKVYSSNDAFGRRWNRKMIIQSSQNLNIAGKKTTKKAFGEWMKNHPEYLETINQVGIDFSNKHDVDHAYFVFNRNLISPDKSFKEARDSFFKYLGDKGYDAVHDINDQFQSGVVAPIYIFNSLGDLKIKDIVNMPR